MVFWCVAASFYTGDPDVILKCIVFGFFANAARIHHSGSYRWERSWPFITFFIRCPTFPSKGLISVFVTHTRIYLPCQDFTRRPWASHPPQLCAVWRETSKMVSTFSFCSTINNRFLLLPYSCTFLYMKYFTLSPFQGCFQWSGADVKILHAWCDCCWVVLVGWVGPSLL